MTRPNSGPREIPHNLEAEQAILGAALLEGRPVMDVVIGAGLVDTDFYAESHRYVYAALRRLYDAETPLDPVTVGEMLRRHGLYDQAGGPAALAVLVEAAALAVHVDRYASILVDLGKHRELIQAGTSAVTDGFAARRSADDVMGALSTELDRIGRRGHGQEYDPAVAWGRVVERWGGRSTVRTGFEAIDRLSGGLGCGEVVVVGALRSCGKTALTLDRARRWAQAGHTVDVLCLEESEEAATRRLVAAESGLTMLELRSGHLSPAAFAKAEEGVAAIQNLPLRLLTVQSLRSLDERVILGAVSLSRAEIVMLDHVGKIEYRRVKRDELRTYEVQRVMDRLHSYALRDGKVIWVTAQLRREAEVRMLQRKDAVPMLSDLADSSALERVARQVWLLDWPYRLGRQRKGSVLGDEYAPEVYWIHLAKLSEGETGRAQLKYRAAAGRFGEVGEDLG